MHSTRRREQNMRINHNISAIKANSHLQRTNSAMNRSIERLSSGYRINRAADDAAGMAISQKMKTQIRGLEQASRNASDGISVIQTAEGALTEVESMLQRMRELSVQAANGTNTDTDREAIQLEINQLNEEIQRISETTEFNTKTLLDGNVDRKSYSNNSKVRLISLTDAVESKDYNVKVTGEASRAIITGGGLGTFPITEETAGTININGQAVKLVVGDELETVYSKLRNLGDTINVNVYTGSRNTTTGEIDYEEVKAGAKLSFEAERYGSRYGVQIYSDNTKLLQNLGLELPDPDADDEDNPLKAKGIDATIELEKDATKATSFANTTTVVADGNKINITDNGGFKMVLEVQKGAVETDGGAATITVLEQGPITLQIGANEGQTIKVSIPKVSPITLGTDSINIGTEDGAQEAISVLDAAINEVSFIRAKLGAYQNRLDHAITNLETSNENLTESLSRIEDVDMAEEMSEYTQKSVLAQAGTSMLAQANEQPQTVLSLLQG